jgi:CheY-like chemotaxis protein
MNICRGIGSACVLVVDDNRDAADSLALLLSVWGCEPVVAYDGSAAVEAARSRVPAAVLLDLGLPGLDGCEVARRLRACPGMGSSLLIAVTGYGREEDRRRTRTAGFDHHLLKPADPEEVHRLLAGICRPGAAAGLSHSPMDPRPSCLPS